MDLPRSGGVLFFNSQKAEVTEKPMVKAEVTRTVSTEGLASLLNNSLFDTMIVDNGKDPIHWFIWQALTEWQTFVFEYTNPETADEVVRVSFELGKDVATTIYFDDVIIANK